MLKLHTLTEKRASSDRSPGRWFELSPGPDDGKCWAPDGAFFWTDEWLEVAEPIIIDRLPGYDRYGRATVSADDWAFALSYVKDLCSRLKEVDEPSMVHVAASELPASLRHRLDREFPNSCSGLAEDLEVVSKWCHAALKRWHCITVIGL